MLNMGSAIVAVILLIILVIYNISGCAAQPGKKWVKWRTGPRKQVKLIKKLYGNPTHINSSPNGVAVWGKKALANTPFTRIMIIDEAVPHNDPTTHCDFLYATIKTVIDRDLLSDIFLISESIMYDQLKQELTVRCGHLSAVVATLALCLQVSNNQLTYTEILSKDLYAQAIRQADKKFTKNYSELELNYQKTKLRDIDESICY